MRSYVRSHPSEVRLLAVLLAIVAFLAFASKSFLTLGNLSSLLNNNAVNEIWAAGLLVVLIAGGIDISFAVAASVVQYLCVYAFMAIGGGNWPIGFLFAAAFGIAIGCVNAALIHFFRIISIVVTIATYNALFGLLMFATSGRGLYDLPDWWTSRINIFQARAADGTWINLALPVAAMVGAMAATWFLVSRTTIGRQLYAFGDNPEGALRAGIDVRRMKFIAFGWMGMMAGIGGLMQVNIVQEVVPNALIGRELDVLAAVVLGGARLGGGRGSVFGGFLGVLLVAVVQNGLNLLGVSPFAFKMVIGLTILAAISTSNLDLSALLQSREGARGGSAS
jgi:simple sugar transport system permease protein